MTVKDANRHRGKARDHVEDGHQKPERETERAEASYQAFRGVSGLGFGFRVKTTPVVFTITCRTRSSSALLAQGSGKKTSSSLGAGVVIDSDSDVPPPPKLTVLNGDCSRGHYNPYFGLLV